MKAPVVKRLAPSRASSDEFLFHEFESRVLREHARFAHVKLFLDGACTFDWFSGRE